MRDFDGILLIVGVAFLMSLLLSGCTRAVVNNAMLPDVVKYSKATQAQAAAEVDANACPVHIELAKDYHVMRNQVRAAKGEKVYLPK